MAVKVIKFKVRHDGNTYTTEEGNNIITGLSEKEEISLIEGGFCEKIMVEKDVVIKAGNKKKNDKLKKEDEFVVSEDETGEDEDGIINLNLNPDDVVVDGK